MLLRRCRPRGRSDRAGFSIAGPSAAGISRLNAYLDDVLIEVVRLGI
jgi:hypothetical protein